MSTFYYGYSIEYSSMYLGVRCDICGNALYTRRTGQEFPEHVTIDARSAGWEHKNHDGYGDRISFFDRLDPDLLCGR